VKIQKISQWTISRDKRNGVPPETTKENLERDCGIVRLVVKAIGCPKGWDSAAQFSFCIQESLKGNPQFWWVKQVLSKFPHPPDWDHVSRGPDGKYKSFPGGKASLMQGLRKFAGTLLERGHTEEAAQIIKIAGYADILREIERVEALLRKGTLNKLTLTLIGGPKRLADQFDAELEIITKIDTPLAREYISVIKKKLSAIISLLQTIRLQPAKYGNDVDVAETIDKILESLQQVESKYGT